MVKLIKMKVDLDIPYMFCYSNEADIEKYEGNWYIPNTGIELDKETQIDLDDESKDELSMLRGKNCSFLHALSYEYQDEDYEIQGKPKVILSKKLEDGTEVYETESPAYVKLNDNGVKKTLLIKSLISCLAVFITNGIYLVGYHLVSGDENTQLEIDKKIQLQNLLRRFGMTPDNSKLLFYGQERHKSKHSEPIKDLVSLLGYNNYRVYLASDSFVTFSNDLLENSNIRVAERETKESKE